MLTLSVFRQEWQSDYVENNRANPLFVAEQVSRLTLPQIQHLIRALYHIRGHFYKPLWFTGSLGTSEAFKEVVLANITEEFGGRGESHEQLYWRFAEEFGVNIKEEIFSERTYLPFIQGFNQGHLNWALTKDWPRVWGAYSAYELLDNVDYPFLYETAKSCGTSPTGLAFFKVHIGVDHYDQANPLLEAIWERNPMAVQDGFRFIAAHQTKVWRNLAKAVFAYA